MLLLAFLSGLHVHSPTRLELRINAQIPVRNVCLKIGMQVPDNSVKNFQYNCMPFRFPKNILSEFPELKALHSLNPRDELDLADKMHSLDFRIEQQKKQ